MLKKLLLPLFLLVSPAHADSLFPVVAHFIPSEVHLEAGADDEEDDANAPFSKPKKMRWGVLGTADVALHDMIPALQASRHSRVAALASRQKRYGKKVAKGLGIATCYDKYDALLQDPNVDAVYIALPNHLHKQWVIKAAEAGKHVLCEKPLGISADDCQQMIDACQKHKVQLMEAMKYRYHPQIERIRELLNAGAIGTPLLIKISLSYPLATVGPEDDFRWKRRQGGGSTLDLGCYGVDAARTLFEAEPLSVTATTIEDPAFPGVDAQLHAILTFPNDLTAIIDCSLLSEERQEIEIVGREGRLIARQAFQPGIYGPIIVEWQREGGYGTEEMPPENLFQLEAAHFVDCLRENLHPITSGEEALRTAKVLDAIHRAASSGRAVTIR